MPKFPVQLICAQSENGVIGAKGKMPWHLPEDLQFFRRMTWNCPVIMGRKTWESLPPSFKPLPHRHNIVLSRHPPNESAGAVWVTSASAALAEAALYLSKLGEQKDQSQPAIWVIGGAEVFKLFEPFASAAYVTFVRGHYEGDAVVPAQRSSSWQTLCQDPQEGWNQSRAGLEYRREVFSLPRAPSATSLQAKAA